MIWLELRRHDDYNNGWGFKESVWSYTLRANGYPWPFWSSIKDVIKGDLIFHLSLNEGDNKFVGVSTAASDGNITHHPNPNDNRPVYKADLENFQPFDPVIRLSDYFIDNNEALREYLTLNKDKHLFYHLNENDELRCTEGAYISEFGPKLAEMLSQIYHNERENKVITGNANTGVAPAEVDRRIGHQIFSKNVKDNFGNICCFPECNVDEKKFLVSGHIARWADNEELRGYTGNGLCLCLMHDKAFERGYFTLDDECHVVIVDHELVEGKEWLSDLLQDGDTIEIRPRLNEPLRLDALEEHRNRIGYIPPQD